MTETSLVLSQLDVTAGSRPVLHGLDLVVGAGETHVLFGPNGSGKSSLLAAIMGLAPYQVTHGEIRFAGDRIDELPVDMRARKGIGMAFQRPPALAGVTVSALSKALGADERLGREAEALDLAGFATRM